MQIPTIIDIEASGFGSTSYPIEVGVARADGQKYCRLIVPFSDWTHWEDEAEQLHGLTRAALATYGVPGYQVCQELNDFLGNSTAYTDGWVVDSPWLIKLYAAAGMEMTFRISALDYILNEKQMDIWYQTKRQVSASIQLKRHRASTDADVIQKTYVKSKQIAQGIQKTAS